MHIVTTPKINCFFVYSSGCEKYAVTHPNSFTGATTSRKERKLHLAQELYRTRGKGDGGREWVFKMLPPHTLFLVQVGEILFHKTEVGLACPSIQSLCYRKRASYQYFTLSLSKPVGYLSQELWCIIHTSIVLRYIIHTSIVLRCIIHKYSIKVYYTHKYSIKVYYTHKYSIMVYYTHKYSVKWTIKEALYSWLGPRSRIDVRLQPLLKYHALVYSYRVENFMKVDAHFNHKVHYITSIDTWVSQESVVTISWTQHRM